MRNRSLESPQESSAEVSNSLNQLGNSPVPNQYRSWCIQTHCHWQVLDFATRSEFHWQHFLSDNSCFRSMNRRDCSCCWFWKLQFYKKIVKNFDCHIFWIDSSKFWTFDWNFDQNSKKLDCGSKKNWVSDFQVKIVK